MLGITISDTGIVIPEAGIVISVIETIVSDTGIIVFVLGITISDTGIVIPEAETIVFANKPTLPFKKQLLNLPKMFKAVFIDFTFGMKLPKVSF